MILDRFDEDFTEFRCADCDPDACGEDEAEYEKPYVFLVPAGDPTPEHCPRCGGYLSFIERDAKLRITNHSRERWAAKRVAKAAGAASA